MHIIDHFLQPPYQGQGSIVDTIALTWEQRCKSRQRVVTQHGREVALALPTGTRLRSGDLLPTPEGLITVECAAEDVLYIRPRDPQEAAFVAYQIGNRHLPLDIDAQGLKTLYEALLETYLRQHAIPAERAFLPFSPVTSMSGHRHP